MKFAYLIMAHHRFDILLLLLKDLDDKRNDIFLHIDKKTRDVDLLYFQKCVKNATLVFVDRMSVYWSDYSQIKCVHALLKAAVKYGYHDYYHFLVGVEFPIKSQDYIHSFFEKNNGKEFVGYDLQCKNYLDRIRYYHFFGKYARTTSKRHHSLFLKGKELVSFQQKHGFSRIKLDESYYKKGYANWSITHEVALLFVQSVNKIKSKYRFTSCADEIIFHTILYNSEYRDRIFDYNDEYHSAMRLTTWANSKNQLQMEDLEMILCSDKLFARKFDTNDAAEIIYKIIQLRE